MLERVLALPGNQNTGLFINTESTYSNHHLLLMSKVHALRMHILKSEGHSPVSPRTQTASTWCMMYFPSHPDVQGINRKRDFTLLPLCPHPEHESHLNTEPHTRNTDSTASKPTSCSLC